LTTACALRSSFSGLVANSPEDGLGMEYEFMRLAFLFEKICNVTESI